MLIDVIGGSGFVGTRLCRRLIEAGYDVRILDKNISATYPQLNVICDVRSLEQLNLGVREGSVIVNLAAEHRDDVRPLCLYDEVNVQGAKNICEAAKSKNVQKIIFTSSVAVYGFAPIGTDEIGNIAPFNDYGRTKWEAEQVFKEWQSKDSSNRTLVTVRPTVIFGERNRGNVYNLLKQIASGRFVMIGDGLNRKSMAYVENVVSFLEYSFSFNPGVHVYNYIDKPDFTMNHLVEHVFKLLGRSSKVKIRIPYLLGISIGKIFDLLALLLKKKFTISSIRIRKFCANSVYQSSVDKTGFMPPVLILNAIEETVRYEFIENHEKEVVFYSE